MSGGGVPTLRDLSLISVPKWYLLGLQLGVSGDELDVIERNYARDDHMCKVKMFGTWLRVDTHATYEKLARAFVTAGYRNTAETLCTARGPRGESDVDIVGIPLTVLGDRQAAAVDYTVMKAVDYPTSGASMKPSRKRGRKHQVTAASAHQELSKAADFARENRQAITAKFADFQTKVCNKLFKNGVDTEEFRLFVTNQFPPGDFIPESPTTLTKVFEAITQHGLWNYFHYSPLVQIAKKFGADDPEVDSWVQTYKKDLKAYSLVATVEDYIEADLDDVDPRTAKIAKYDPHYYTPVEWKTKFVDHSLQYLTEVWESFSYHYLVPDSPPTALLDRVRRGCFLVTWLVPSGLIPLLVRVVKIDTEFFQQHRILRVTVGGECIYEEDTEETTSEAHQKGSLPSKLPLVSEGGVEPHGRPQQKETCGGYDCKFAEPPASGVQTYCPICGLILQDPHLTNCCGINFCCTCIARLQAERKSCPTCNEDKFELLPNKSLKHSLSQLHVLCTHSEVGCKWTGELSKLQHHLNEVVHSVPHTPSPSRFTLKKMATTPLNPEYEAFQRCSADLIRGVQYPEALTWEMYFDNILSEAVVDEVSTVGLSTVQRRIKLLSAVRAEIATDPTKFQKLFQTLRRQPSLKDVAEKLNATYVHHLKVDSRETGLKAASLQEPTNKFETGFPPAELEGQEWYHGWISQETAEERLKMVPYDCFLIRETDQEAHTLSLSVKHQGSISHSLIERYLSGYKIAITQKKFTTLLQLVDFYMTNSISDDPCHQLSSPCPRSSTDDAQQSSDTISTHVSGSKSQLLHPHSRLRWRRATDLPVDMSQNHIVRIGSTVYCGGGYGIDTHTERQVFQYNSKDDEWLQLPVCPTVHFGLTQFNGKLVTVGGRRLANPTPIKEVYVLEESKVWRKSIPPLPTARSHPTAFNYKSTLVVSGGITNWATDSKHRTYTDAVEVFHSKAYQWYRAEPLPVAHNGMSCAIVNEMCYFIGGGKLGAASKHAYCTSVSNFITQTDHTETSSTHQASPLPTMWQVLPKCPLYYSTAADLKGYLLAIGGEDGSDFPSSAVHMYSHSTNSWVKISSGDLPVPRYYAAATELEGGGIIFVGGKIKLGSPTKTVFIASIEQ